MIPYTKENWNECLECLGFKEIKNTMFGGVDILDNNGIPQWSYSTDEQKKNLYLFFNGMVYWQVHKCNSCERNKNKTL